MTSEPGNDKNAAPARPRTFVSSGFTTVDVMFDGSVSASPGGTATNVARALQTLGWNTRVVGTVGNDPAGRFLKEELAHDGVDVSSIHLNQAWTTPVVVQEESRGDHEWRFSCPVCGAKFAKHRPANEASANALAHDTEAPDVFFFDRVSLFTLALAATWSRLGTYIVFEPAALGRPHLFERAVRIADLVKFSKERAPSFHNQLGSSTASIIETLGPSGARLKAAGSESWLHLEATQVDGLVDTAGAGDWTSAGLINTLLDCPAGKNNFDLERAVAAGQVLGARACTWKGVFPDALRPIQGGFEPFGCPRVLHETQVA
jgi:fructokinase